MKVSEFNAIHPLASAVRRQLGNPSITETLETLADVRRGGADGGFGGFVYYCDTEAFARKHRVDILDSLKDDASNMGKGSGMNGAARIVSGFRCVRREEASFDAIYAALAGGRIPSNVSKFDLTAVRNALAWYALETVANAAKILRD